LPNAELWRRSLLRRAPLPNADGDAHTDADALSRMHAHTHGNAYRNSYADADSYLRYAYAPTKQHAYAYRDSAAGRRQSRERRQ
jgi:hypothetical protein